MSIRPGIRPPPQAPRNENQPMKIQPSNTSIRPGIRPQPQSTRKENPPLKIQPPNISINPATQPPPQAPGKENQSMKKQLGNDANTKKNKNVGSKDPFSFLSVSKSISRAYLPLRLVMLALSRFPISFGHKASGTLSWEAKKISFCKFFFVLNCILQFFIFVLFIVNGTGILLNTPEISSKTQTNKILHVEEWFLFRRNVLPFIILFVNSLHIVVCSWNWLWKRKFIADFFNFWIAAEHQMKLEVTGHATLFSLILLGGYGLILIIFCCVVFLQISPICTGAPAIIVQMLLRCFYTDIHTWESFSSFRLVATFLCLYIMICSKIHIMFFMVQCYMIKYTVRLWNDRVEEALNSEHVHSDIEIRKTRSTGTMLFQDQVCILDLIDGNDIMFTNVIESYYLAQIVTISFEVYFIYRIEENAGDFHGVRRYDGYLVTFHLAFTVIFMLLVSIVSGQVGEETVNGIQSVRNKGLLGRKDEAHLNLVLSMYYNYVGFWEAVVNGGKYFPINKQLFMKALAACMTYIFCLIQFEMGFRYVKDPIVPEIHFEKLINNVESVNKDWWGKRFQQERYLDKTGVYNK